MLPLVTVIMPAYNCSSTIEQSVRSVLAQTFTDLELLVIDDGSYDQTLDLLSELSAEDSRIIIFRNQRNQGVAAARNKGLEHAKGAYIAFLDGDDIWKPQKLEEQLKYLEKTKGDLCYTSYGFISSAGTVTQKYYYVPEHVNYKKLLCENVIGLSTVLIQRDSLGDLRFNSRWFHEDYVLWLELLRTGKVAGGLSEVLVYYRKGGRSANKLKAAGNRWAIYRKAENLSIFASSYYLIRYILAAFRKYSHITKISVKAGK